jgi:hypothetical protein
MTLVSYNPNPIQCMQYDNVVSSTSRRAQWVIEPIHRYKNARNLKLKLSLTQEALKYNRYTFSVVLYLVKMVLMKIRPTTKG